MTDLTKTMVDIARAGAQAAGARPQAAAETAKHTPGPWRDGTEGNFRIYGRDGQDVAEALPRVLNTREWRANARLIAAAPDLLEALKELQPFFEGEHHPDHPHCRQMRAAIAKAEGR